MANLMNMMIDDKRSALDGFLHPNVVVDSNQPRRHDIPKDMVKRLLSALRLNEFHLADPGFRRDVGSEVATLVAGGGELRNPQVDPLI